MADTSHQGLKWIMRAGYVARGLIYTIVGILAFRAAFSSGTASGTEDALRTLRAEPFGTAALWAIAIGLFAYLIWRVIAGVADVDDHGNAPKGLAARAGVVTTGLLHGIVAVSVIGLTEGGGSGSAAQDWTQTVMQVPLGRWLVGTGAMILAGAGLYYAYKGWSGSYKDSLASSDLTRTLAPVLKAGLIVHGGLLFLVAVSVAFAALNADPAQAGGLGQALHQLREMSFGKFLLAGAGLGLIAFALYNFVEAGYRVVPRITGTDVETLNGRLKEAG